MRIAAVYDIHGNLPALEAVLAEVRQLNVDQVVVGGDVVPGPFPVATLECLLDLGVATQFIYGNGEAAVLEQMAGRQPAAVPEYDLAEAARRIRASGCPEAEDFVTRYVMKSPSEKQMLEAFSRVEVSDGWQARDR